MSGIGFSKSISWIALLSTPQRTQYPDLEKIE